MRVPVDGLGCPVTIRLPLPHTVEKGQVAHAGKFQFVRQTLVGTNREGDRYEIPYWNMFNATEDEE